MKKNAKLMMMFCMLLFAIAVIAQEAIPTAEAPSQAPESKTTLWGLWKTGGWAMYPIGLLSVGAVGMTIFGFISTKQSKMVQIDLVPELQQRIQGLDFQSVNAVCSGSPGIMTNILQAGISRLEEDHLEVDAVEKAMEEAAVEENTSGLKPINYLSIIASIAPMLGLLGTVSGMIKAFNKMEFGGMGNPELLAGDIGEAMVTTAFGLVVGIPAMFFYFFLKNQFLTNMSQVGRVLGKLTHEMELALKRAKSGGGVNLAAAAPQQEIPEAGSEA